MVSMFQAMLGFPILALSNFPFILIFEMLVDKYFKVYDS